LTVNVERIALRHCPRGESTKITSGTFIKKHDLHSSGSVQTSASQLFDKEIITQENNVYSVYDRFFGLWLNRVF
jgi:hypothetical protein